MELKIYAVPPAQTMNLVGSLGNALGDKANITSPMPGKLLVYAAHDAQASIGEAIASLGQSIGSAAKPAQVDLQFWIVDGAPGPGTDDPALKPLAVALESVRQTMGPLHFTLDQSLAARGSSGRDGTISSAPELFYPRRLDFTVTGVSGKVIDLFLDYEDHGATGIATFKTQINTQSGHYVVLAQGPGACPAAVPGKTAPPCPVKPALRLLIVRADIVPPPA